MHEDYAQISPDLQVGVELAQHLRQRLATFLAPLLTQLQARMNARLVRTFLATLEAILCFRNRAHGLLLSELGGGEFLYDRGCFNPHQVQFLPGFNLRQKQVIDE
jgi:hypothetical protein